MSCEEDYRGLSGDFAATEALIDAASSIALCGHTDPDGDALGSVLGMRELIALRWPEKTVYVLTADDRVPPCAYAYLPGYEEFVAASSFDEDVDLFISLDTPTPQRLAHGAPVLDRARTSAAFDHHATMTRFASVNCLVKTAASTGDIVYEFMRFLGLEPSPAFATCILTAVITDTGRFQYQNTDCHAFDVAAHMTAAGGSASAISAAVYMSSSLESLRLESRVLERLKVDESGSVAYSYISEDDLEETGATNEDCESLIDLVRQLRGVDACVFLRQRPDGTNRGNLRSKVDWLDVSRVAATFGGGGHKAAAGFTSTCSLEESIDAVLAALRAQIENDRP